MLRISADGACITALHFCNNEEDMQQAAAVAVDATSVLQQCVNQLMEYFQGQRTVFNIPVQQGGTAFQQRVWAELLNIPYGKNISYLTMARRLGDPNVIRAAASANGKNNIAIIVPCHRVIGSNNELTGYGGGLWRKKLLLDLEAKYTHGVQTLF